MSPSPALLEIQDLHAYYGQSHVLHGVDVRLEAGQTLALLGRNGMGKTTLIRAIFGLLTEKTGRITFQGHDISDLAPHAISRLGLALVPEGRGVFPTLSVTENMRLAARPGPDGGQDWTRTRAFEAFPRLAERRDHFGNQLSGGEQQMLAIARALLTNPKLLILDEATEGLAPKIRAEIWDHIRAIATSGIATIVVDKDLNALAGTCTDTIVLDKGRIAHGGPMAAFAADKATHERLLGV